MPSKNIIYELYVQDKKGNILEKTVREDSILPRVGDHVMYYTKRDDRQRVYDVIEVVHHLEGNGIAPTLVIRER